MRLKVKEICEPLDEFMPTKPVQFTLTSTHNDLSTTPTNTTVIALSKDIKTDVIKTKEKDDDDQKNNEVNKLETVQGTNEEEAKIKEVSLKVDDEVSNGETSNESSVVNKVTENASEISDSTTLEGDTYPTKDNDNSVQDDNEEEKDENTEENEKEVDDDVRETTESDQLTGPETPATTDTIPDS